MSQYESLYLLIAKLCSFSYLWSKVYEILSYYVIDFFAARFRTLPFQDRTKHSRSGFNFTILFLTGDCFKKLVHFTFIRFKKKRSSFSRESLLNMIDLRSWTRRNESCAKNAENPSSRRSIFNATFEFITWLVKIRICSSF